MEYSTGSNMHVTPVTPVLGKLTHKSHEVEAHFLSTGVCRKMLFTDPKTKYNTYKSMVCDINADVELLNTAKDAWP